MITYAITEDQRDLFRKVVANAACSHFISDRPLIIEADKMLQSLHKLEGEPVAWVTGKDAQKSYEISNGLPAGTLLYTHPLPSRTQITARCANEE